MHPGPNTLHIAPQSSHQGTTTIAFLSSETISCTYLGVASWGAVRLLFRGYRVRTCGPRCIKFLTTHFWESLTIHFRQSAQTLGLELGLGKASASLLTMIAQGAQWRQSAQNGSQMSPGMFGKSTLGSERGTGRRSGPVGWGTYMAKKQRRSTVPSCPRSTDRCPHDASSP